MALNARKQLDNLINALIEDLFVATDEEILEAIEENGEDPEKVVDEVRQLLEQAMKRIRSTP